MKTLQPNHFIVDQFWLAFRKGAHKLIWMGYQRAMVRIRLTSDEESVTGFLYEAITEIIKYGEESWCQKYEAKNENPLPSSLRTGKSRRKTDLIILHVFKKSHPEFVFEAKALNSSKMHQLEDNYLNEDGLKRFLKGDYADYTRLVVFFQLEHISRSSVTVDDRSHQCGGTHAARMKFSKGESCSS